MKNSLEDSLMQWSLQNAEVLQVWLFFTLFGTLSVVERLIPFRSTAKVGKNRLVSNFGLTALNILFLSILPVGLFSVSVYCSESGLGLLNWVELPLVLSILANLLGRGFISFFTHFLMHKVPLFWRIHRVHHFDTELDVTTTVRFHPMEFILSALVGIPLVLVLGLSPWLLLFYELLDVIVTLLSHSNFRFPPKLESILRLGIVTPDLHRVHHSAWHRETDSNFGAVFPIWDMIFRTYRVNTKKPQRFMTLGLDVRDGREQSFLWLLSSPVTLGNVKKRQSNRSVRDSDLDGLYPVRRK